LRFTPVTRSALEVQESQERDATAARAADGRSTVVNDQSITDYFDHHLRRRPRSNIVEHRSLRRNVVSDATASFKSLIRLC
jgi:hypothetical protein